MGVVKGYVPQILYQDDEVEIKPDWAPYALAWGSFGIKLHKKYPIYVGADINAVPTAFGWQSKLTFEKNW